MSKLVNQLLQLSRADRHKESLHLEEFDLSELTEMVAEEAQGLAESKAVTLTAEIEPGILVKADQTLMMRIWLNLLTNAVKYGRQQGQIWLTLKSDGKNAVGTVRDDGIGISAAELPKIWKRFYRVNTARSSGDDTRYRFRAGDGEMDGRKSWRNSKRCQYLRGRQYFQLYDPAAAFVK